jgi:cysteine desulfurase
MEYMQPLENTEIYLDNNATTKVLLDIAEAVVSAITTHFGNPSSAHAAGERAREGLRNARENVASLLGCDSTNVVFIGSGTEANNIILSSAANRKKTKTFILTTSVEHSSILAMCDHLESEGIDIVRIGVDRNGMVKLPELKSALSDGMSLVSVQWVNNETGVIQPVEEIGQLCMEAGIPFHTDAAQAVGKIRINLSELPIDYLSFTGHKLHAPQGVGVLYAKNMRSICPMLYGGSQENSIRPGTENLAGIAGLGKAVELRASEFDRNIEYMDSLRKAFESMLLGAVHSIRINGVGAPRVCNTTNVLFEGVDGQALTARLDQEGIRCSQSSACTNQRPEPSYVLRAMGLTEDEAYSSIRFSFSVLNTLQDVERAVPTIAKLCERLRAFGI